MIERWSVGTLGEFESEEGGWIRYEDYQEEFATSHKAVKQLVERITQLTAANADKDLTIEAYAKLKDQLVAERDAALRQNGRLKALIGKLNTEVQRLNIDHCEETRLLNDEIDILKAPMSDEEWGKGCHLANKSHVNDIIANRLRTSHDQ